MDKITLALGVALVAVVLAISGFFFHTGSQGSQGFGAVGGVTALNSLGLSQVRIGSNCNDGFKYGSCNGTAVNQLLYGSCSLWVGTSTVFTIAATSSAAVDCNSVNGLANQANVETPITGILTGDNISLEMPTTTPSTYNGIRVSGIDASSTNGYITLLITNETGATFTFATSSATGLQYVDIR